MADPIPTPSVLTLKREVLENVDDSAGRWQFTGGKVYQGKEHVAYYAGTKRVIFGATDPQNTASLTITIFFIGEKPPQNITLQGTHDFNSGDQIGSVSAASSKYAAVIGAQFFRSGAADTITINP
jgi:hypothetical protein